jgi:hypothetical protein
MGTSSAGAPSGPQARNPEPRVNPGLCFPGPLGQRTCLYPSILAPEAHNQFRNTPYDFGAQPRSSPEICPLLRLLRAMLVLLAIHSEDYPSLFFVVAMADSLALESLASVATSSLNVVERVFTAEVRPRALAKEMALVYPAIS